MPNTEVNQEYNAEQIQVLEGLEPVRKRPGMYIGSTSEQGLHHLVYEIVDNSVDEALAGYCTEINVTITGENAIRVSDNGRGMPVDMHPKLGIPAVEVIHTVLHAGGKFGGGGYKVSGGLHGVGASVVNALSEAMEVEVRRDGKVYRQRYERGKTMYPLKEDGVSDHTGTTTWFKPDPEIFKESVVFNYSTLEHRLREMAFLNKGIKITLTDERGEAPKTDTFHYEGGIKEFVKFINRNKEPIHPDILYFEVIKQNFECEVALQYTDRYNEFILSYANNINTTEGGTHLVGFKTALTRAYNDYARKSKILKENESALTGEDIREGITAIVSVKLTDPQFEGQTKTKLGNSEIRGFVDNATNEHITAFLKKTLSRPVLSSKKDFAQREREKLRERPEISLGERVLSTV